MRPAPLSLLLLLLVVTACDGFLSRHPEGTIGVPYYAQQQYNYCVPASIQMWRGYDGVKPFLTQDDIWWSLGGAPCDGNDALRGVHQFTATGIDAYIDFAGWNQHPEFMARQITSIDHEIPVLVIVDPDVRHVGILNGGSYNYDYNFDVWRWETVYFHDPDPAVGANFLYTSDQWIDRVCRNIYSTCYQVISSTATTGWDINHVQYGSRVETYEGFGVEENQDDPY